MAAMASADERKLRKVYEKLDALEREATRLKQKSGAMAVQDYALTGPGGGKTKLSTAFGEHELMVLVHNMGQSCPYCTLWADSFNSIWRHVEQGVPGVKQRAAFVVVSPDDHATQKKFAKSRKWGFRMLSAKGTSLFADLGFADDKGNPWPGVSILRRKGRKITRVAKDFFGPGDRYNAIFSFFGLMEPPKAG